MDNTGNQPNIDSSIYEKNIAEDTAAELDTSDTENLNSDISSENQIANLEQKIAELQDLYVRSQAELQNIQRRSSDDVKKARDYAISSFAKDMIIVKDYLEMALKDQSGNFEAIKMGVDLTLKQLVQIFEQQRIKEINPELRAKLDPHLHQAMTTVEEDGASPNTIISVMQKGYILNERVLRPAMVTVTK